MSYLIFVNGLGPNYKGDNIYEFIFSDLDDVWGDDWDAEPAAGKPLPPDVNYIKKVGVLKNSEIELNLIQNSDFFGMYENNTNETDFVIDLENVVRWLKSRKETIKNTLTNSYIKNIDYMKNIKYL